MCQLPPGFTGFSQLPTCIHRKTFIIFILHHSSLVIPTFTHTVRKQRASYAFPQRGLCDVLINGTVTTTANGSNVSLGLTYFHQLMLCSVMAICITCMSSIFVSVQSPPYADSNRFQTLQTSDQQWFVGHVIVDLQVAQSQHCCPSRHSNHHSGFLCVVAVDNSSHRSPFAPLLEVEFACYLLSSFMSIML